MYSEAKREDSLDLALLRVCTRLNVGLRYSGTVLLKCSSLSENLLRSVSYLTLDNRVMSSCLLLLTLNTSCVYGKRAPLIPEEPGVGLLKSGRRIFWG